MENANILNDIQNLVTNAGVTAAPAPTAAPATPATETTKSTRPPKPDGHYKWNKALEKWEPLTGKELENAQKAEHKANILDNALAFANSANSSNPTKVRILRAISKNSRIAAYLVKNNEKLDFAGVKESKESAEYTIKVKQSAPSAILGVVVMEPTELHRLLDKFPSEGSTPEFINLLDSLENKPYEAHTVKPHIVPWAEFISYLCERTAGWIAEDDAIFTPYATKKAVFQRPGDIPSANGSSRPAGSNIYVQVQATTDKKKMFAIKHSCRAKILTPDNFVALKQYKTAAFKTQYTPDEASALIAAHLNRFLTKTSSSDNAKASIASKLSARGRALVTPNDNCTSIDSSTYFSTDAGKSWLATADAKAVAHWYKKHTDEALRGTPVNLTTSELLLVDKEFVAGKDGKKGKVRTNVNTLGLANSSSPYKFDEATFPGIYTALRKADICDQITAFFGSTSSRKSNTTSKAKSSRPKTKIELSQLAGMSLEDITAKLLISDK